MSSLHSENVPSCGEEMSNNWLIISGSVAAAATGVGAVVMISQNSLTAEPSVQVDERFKKGTLLRDRAISSYFTRCSAALLKLSDDVPKSSSRVPVGPAILSSADFKRASVTIGALAQMVSPDGSLQTTQIADRRMEMKARFKSLDPELVGFTDKCLRRSYAFAPVFMREKAKRAKQNKG